MKQKRKDIIKSFISIILVIVMIVSGIGIKDSTREVNADTETITLYFIDNTGEKWVKNDNAIMQLVDNSNGHDYYNMIKVDDTTWSVEVPKTAYNITFNRLNPSDNTQWNSWSAGGKDSNNAYYADGAEYGHWEVIESEEEENYFHAGDIIYLDLTEFTAWENDGALMYVNFTDASKENNGGNDITIKTADKSLYCPETTDFKEDNYIYTYFVSKGDEGKTELRFWRGNSTKLWNCSIILDYEQYKQGYNCVNVNGWNSSGYLSKKEYDINFEMDKDNDDVADYLEAFFGLDKNNGDSDGDGLSDYNEIVITETDPLIYDSVEEGISDALIDSDEDGLSNEDEIVFETNPIISDTDDDGLSDYDEIYVYYTEATVSDTDGDGLNDGDEIVLGFNPNLADTDGNGIIDSKEYVKQNVNSDRFESDLYTDNVAIPTSLTILAKGNINNNIRISEYNEYLKGDERAYIGKAVEISGCKFYAGNITFSFESTYNVNNYMMGNGMTNGLIICYNDGCNTIPLETTYNSETKTVTADIYSEGIYFVLDVVDWLDSIGVEYGVDDVEVSESDNIATFTLLNESNEASISNIEIKGQTDIVFIVDTTGSMSSYISNVKNNIIEFVNEIDAAGITPYFALIDYKDITCDGQYSTNVKKNFDGSNWFKSAYDFKNEISKLSVSGGSDEPETVIDALEMARQLDLRESSHKFFIVVTDAGFKVNNNYGISSMDEMIEYLNKDNINVSVVSSGYNSYEYKDLYEKTGGVYANVSGNFKEELFSIADMIKDDTNNGYWVALNGLIPQLVRLDEKPVINGTCDTDGDSLLDWKELADLQEAKSMDITPFLNKLGFEFTEIDKTIPVYNYISNPVKEDSDGDGLLDGKPLYSDKGEVVAPIDTQPLRKNGTKEIWESHINNINTNVIPDDYCDDFDLGEEVEGILPNTAKRYLSKAEKKLADSLVKAMLKLRGTVNNNDSKIRKTVLFVKNKFEGDPVLGAYILNFIYDDEYIGYHSQPETWQRKFGYNEFYDEVFKIGSFMNDGQLFTNCNGKQYALWMWKGDYWNLQSGSEIGLYEYKGKYSGTDQYDAVDFEVPMKMYLYNYYEENNIENVLNWEPKDKQWWITGFNIRYKEPNPKTMVMIGKIDLSDNKYDDLYKSFANINETIYYDININNIIFDDNKCIWIIWYNKEYVE